MRIKFFEKLLGFSLVLLNDFMYKFLIFSICRYFSFHFHSRFLEWAVSKFNDGNVCRLYKLAECQINFTSINDKNKNK